MTVSDWRESEGRCDVVVGSQRSQRSVSERVSECCALCCVTYIDDSVAFALLRYSECSLSQTVLPFQPLSGLAALLLSGAAFNSAPSVDCGSVACLDRMHG